MQTKFQLVVLISLFLWTTVTNAQEQAEALNLEQSIAIALQQSAFVHSAQQEIQRADFRQKEARADFFPKVKTGYNFTQLNEPSYTKIPDTGLFPLDRITVGPLHTYVWNITIEQPLFTGWLLTTNYKLAKLGFDIAKLQEMRAKLDLIRQVKEDYFSILKTEKILEVATQAEEQVAEHVKVAQAFFEVGIIPKNDLLQAEVELAQREQDVIRAENGVALAKSKFNTTLRRDINTPVKIIDILTYNPSNLNLDNCLQKAYCNRPEMKEAELKVEEAQKQIEVAKSQFYPGLALKLNYEKQGDTYDIHGTKFRDEESWSVLTSFSWTPWEWGKTYYSVKENQVRLIQAEDMLIQVRDAIALEVKDAYLKLRETEKNIAVAEAAVVQAEENFRLNEQRYKEQVATTTDVMDAQTLLTQAKTNYYNALSDYNIARAQLERAMGITLSEGVE